MLEARKAGIAAALTLWLASATLAAADPVTQGATIAGIAKLAPKAADPTRSQSTSAASLGTRGEETQAGTLAGTTPSIAVPKASPGAMRRKLRLLDHQADRGSFSLEEYRARRDLILRGY